MTLITVISAAIQVKSAFSSKESIQKEVKATLSQKATLTCEVSDINTEVKWYKDGKLLTTSKTVHVESKGRSRQLVINSVDKKDAGEYICEAGSEKLPFKIQVLGKLSLVLSYCMSMSFKIVLLCSISARLPRLYPVSWVIVA